MSDYPSPSDPVRIVNTITNPANVGIAGVVSTGGMTTPAIVEFTRPANLTPYAVNDVVSGDAVATIPMAFALGRIVGKSGYISRARIITNQSTCAAQFRLYLFSVSRIFPADNAQFPLLYSDRLNLIGRIDFPTTTTEGVGSDAAESELDANGVMMAYDCALADYNIYGILVSKTIWTPDSGQIICVELYAEQN